MTAPSSGARRTLAQLSIPSEPGNERRAAEEVARAVSGLGLPEKTLRRFRTAVAEATLNAMEHGNRYRAELPVLIEVSVSEAKLSVKITDEGSGPPAFHSETPDIEAKLEGMQTLRGWGLFLIRNLVDDMNVTADEHHHTVELILHLDVRADREK
ncbi:MAG: ATP-binding protein [Actinomycetota bacterium]|nr:ATP-binding protein [Actinomycetota bacterium]